MLIKVSPQFVDTPLGTKGAKIINKCVHRGFCNSHCPTYLSSNCDDMGPRGRIYLIKRYLEGQSLTDQEMLSIQTCVNCRACETDCPGGVKVAELINLAKNEIDNTYPHLITLRQHALKSVLRLLPSVQIPLAIRNTISTFKAGKPFNQQNKATNILLARAKVINRSKTLALVTECTKPGLADNAHQSAEYIMQYLGYRVTRLPNTQCCGAFKESLRETSSAIQQAKQNIDAWWSQLEPETTNLITISSSCESLLKQYGELLRGDKIYAKKAATLSQKTLNIAELINQSDIDTHLKSSERYRVALHTPCSLRNRVEKHREFAQLMTSLPIIVTKTDNERVCCGSGGTYSLLYPDMSHQIGKMKASDLTTNRPDFIVTANTGCKYHLNKYSDIPIIHWLELVSTLIRNNS